MLIPSFFRRLPALACWLALLLPFVPSPAGAQQPTPEQARRLLETRPDLVRQLRERIGGSGLTPDQIRARLRAAGYPETLLDNYLSAADTTAAPTPGSNVLDAIRLLGIVGAGDLDSLRALTDSARAVADSLRADSLALEERGLRVFGLQVFRRSTTQFQPGLSGPVDPTYQLGPGDVLVLLITGDVELAHTLEVNREGFVVIPQVGSLYVANLTLGQLEDVLYGRLGRVYSGVRRGPAATTKFQVTVARLRTIQVVVVGEVARPGSYPLSSAGTVLTALYVAGGPLPTGSFRHVLLRRAGAVVDSLDLYDYLLAGDSRRDARLQHGDIIFVPVRGSQVKLVGRVTRPAIYELKAPETLRDLIAAAGGFEPDALQRRIQIERILPPALREPGRDRIVLEIGPEQLVEGVPAFPLEPADSVTVFSVAERRRGFVTVSGNVWVPGPVGWRQGMRLNEAIRLAGGPKPDVYLGQVLVSRLQSDSTRIQLRSSFQDSTGTVTNDLLLLDEDEVEIFSRTDFRPERYVAVTGAVRKPGRVPFRSGMTLRDALLQAGGLTEDAFLTEAEIARLPQDRSGGRVAATLRVPLDSSYLFGRSPDGAYIGPPGLPAPASGAPETALEPYDNVLVLRQPDWELQRVVAITGQVKYPGRYSLRRKTDRLLDLIQRAGGLTAEAYPDGVEFHRAAGRKGRIGIDLPRVLRDSRFRDNLVLTGGDSIHIPEYNPVVTVSGSVNSPVAVAHVQGRSVDFYIAAAGGFDRVADRGRTYVVQPNGKVESVKRRFLLPDSKPKPLAGAVVFVPQRDPTDRKDYVAIFGSVAQILASVVTILVVATR